jgi:glucose-1-phosphate thymidylyltransferase
MKRTWGIVPAAGLGTRIQPLAFSKELLPVGMRLDENTERPKAVCEYLLDRMLKAGATRICFVISAGKTDIMNYFGGQIGNAAICYALQANPRGLCDAIFSALPFLGATDDVLIGLPDTVWFPESGFDLLPENEFSFLLFPVNRPELFDAVVVDSTGAVQEVQVKSERASTRWVWGAFRMPGRVLTELHSLWNERNGTDQYIGTLVNEYIARGGQVQGIKSGELYIDVGTLHGYREAVRLLSQDDGLHAQIDVAA